MYNQYGLEFEWDDPKRLGNTAKHGVRFEYALRVFADPNRIDAEDARDDYGEERRLTIGDIDGRIFAVVYTERGQSVRLISARKADKRERREYFEAL